MERDCSFSILAGGRAQRMRAGMDEGSRASGFASSGDLDKCLLRVGDETILERILCRFSATDYVARALNANGDLARFSTIAREHDLSLFCDDDPPSRMGPLAGLLASMRWAHCSGAEWLLTVSGDCPFLPKDLYARLRARQRSSGALIVCARSNLREHPTIGLWSTSLCADLSSSLFSRDIRKIDRWTSGHRLASEDWGEFSIGDPFFNVNDASDLSRANSLARTNFQ